MPKITRLEIRSFRGIRDLTISVPPEGAIVAGGNARGKSSILKAISAALAGQGIGQDAIRLGDDAAEILVDLDALHVRRSITAKGSSLTVTNPEGDKWSKPQSRLNELFGTAALDALSFFLAEPRERRKLVMEALPVTVTAEDLARWAPGATKILGRISLEGHGLEVLDRLHKAFYDLRAEVNKAAKAARAEATAAAHFPPAPEDAPTLEDAEKENAEARKALMQLEAREMAGTEARKASERTTTLIAAMTVSAESRRARHRGAPTDEQLAEAERTHSATIAELQRLEDLIALARKAESEANAHVAGILRARERAAEAELKAAAEEGRALELRASLASVDAMAVPRADIDAARAFLGRTITALDDAKAAATARDAETKAQQLAATATKREADAAQVDEIVRRLATEAPQELAERSALIPGLGIDGDSITLDGVAIDSLSGAEQMRFAVDLCKRLNANAKILVVDGLERLDDDSLDAFVATATAGDWQLIGTRVSKGELVIEALQADAKEAA